MRLTDFWTRMEGWFGDAYAHSVARDQVLATLGGRTVEEALGDGADVKSVWRGVCEAFEIPARVR